MGQVVEGMNALPAAQALSSRCQVEMPLVDAVAMVLDGRDVRETVLSLMTREKKKRILASLSDIIVGSVAENPKGLILPQRF